jgi:hypothetical protein
MEWNGKLRNSPSSSPGWEATQQSQLGMEWNGMGWDWNEMGLGWDGFTSSLAAAYSEA